MTVIVTSERDFEQNAQRVGELLKRPGLPRLANPFKLWVLDPPRREPEPNRRQLT